MPRSRTYSKWRNLPLAERKHIHEIFVRTEKALLLVEFDMVLKQVLLEGFSNKTTSPKDQFASRLHQSL